MPDSKPIPLAAAVQVMRYRPNADTGISEPWPVATIEIDMAGRIAFRGDAGNAYEPLLRAARKAGAKLAEQNIAEALQEARELKEEVQACEA
jgi:hypothetical protein